MRLMFSAALILILAACQGDPTPVKEPVQNFNAQRYMGTWFEIARMPTRFQSDLIKVTAEYRLNEDGTFEVTNRGYNPKDGEWDTAVGKARPVEGMSAGFAVTFQWPFSGGYYVVELGDNYEYAVVVSDSTDYLWLLSREPQLPRWLIDRTLARANEWGYDIDKIIETQH